MITHARARYYGPYEDYGWRQHLGDVCQVLTRPGITRVTKSDQRADLTATAYRAWEDYAREMIVRQARPNERLYFQALEHTPEKVKLPTLRAFWATLRDKEGSSFYLFDTQRGEWMDVDKNPIPIPLGLWTHLTGAVDPSVYRGDVSTIHHTQAAIIRLAEHIIHTTQDGLAAWERYVSEWARTNRGKRYVSLPDPHVWHKAAPPEIKKSTKVTDK
jgi:hypothetical protein